MKKIHQQNYYKIQSPESKTQAVIKGAIKEILAVAGENINKPAKQLVVLDVGCGSGEYAFEMEKNVKKVYGVEPYTPKYKEALADKKKIGSKVIFNNSLIENFKPKRKFDLIFSLTTVEHMPNAERSFKAMLKLLKKNGIIYITCPNKWWPMESHYKLPFLAWLPLKLANIYLKLAIGEHTYIDCSYTKSYSGMKKLLDSVNSNYQFILPKDPNSAYIGCGPKPIGYDFIKNTGIKLIRQYPVFWHLSKGFMIVVTKK